MGRDVSRRFLMSNFEAKSGQSKLSPFSLMKINHGFTTKKIKK